MDENLSSGKDLSNGEKGTMQSNQSEYDFLRKRSEPPAPVDRADFTLKDPPIYKS